MCVCVVLKITLQFSLPELWAFFQLFSASFVVYFYEVDRASFRTKRSDRLTDFFSSSCHVLTSDVIVRRAVAEYTRFCLRNSWRHMTHIFKVFTVSQSSVAYSLSVCLLLYEWNDNKSVRLQLLAVVNWLSARLYVTEAYSRPALLDLLTRTYHLSWSTKHTEDQDIRPTVRLKVSL